MRNSSKLILALGTAGVIATGASAFTASSTIDTAAVRVGSVEQTISGANFSNVAYDYTASTDMTNMVTAKADGVISTKDGVVQISVNGSSTLLPCTVTNKNADDSATGTDHSNISCNINLAGVNSVRFIVNG